MQNLKISDLHGHLLFDSTDPALLAGVDDDDDDDDTSLAGVQVNGTSLAGELIPVASNNANDDNFDAESDHNSVDPNEADNNSSKASSKALEAKHQFTLQLMNHRNFLQLGRSGQHG